MNVNEVLIANANLRGSTALLFEGQNITVGVLDPVFQTVKEIHKVEDQEIAYKTEYVYDGVSYETEEEARQAAEEAGDPDPQISEVTVVDQILDEDGNPVDPEKNKLYLVPPTDSSLAEQPNVYNEYIYTENGFELVGSTDINLDELTESDIDDIWNNAFSN